MAGEITLRRLSIAEYRALAAFRLELRRFLAFSKGAAESQGLHPQQYQALLAIKAAPDGELSISELGEQLFVRTHSAVELVARLVAQDLVFRTRSESDRRRICLHLTPGAEETLGGLVAEHVQELTEHAPALIEILTQMSERAGDPER